jgi:hypothetical protein
VLHADAEERLAKQGIKDFRNVRPSAGARITDHLTTSHAHRSDRRQSAQNGSCATERALSAAK